MRAAGGHAGQLARAAAPEAHADDAGNPAGGAGTDRARARRFVN